MQLPLPHRGFRPGGKLPPGWCENLHARLAGESAALECSRFFSLSRTKLETFPRTPLTLGPSPLRRWDRLTEDLGGKVEISAKREDLNPGLAYGGNKTRKREYLAAEALELGGDTLVSIGGIQSNLTRQVVAVAAKLGIKAVLAQERWRSGTSPTMTRQGTFCSHAFLVRM